MTAPAPDARWRREVIRQRLDRMEAAWRAGVDDALGDAVAFCCRMGMPPPAWVSHGVRAALASRGEGDGRLGRHADPAEERRQNLVHYARWDAVKEARERRGEQDMPQTWPEVYSAVSELLRGTPAAGSPEAVKQSYLKVERTMRAGEAAKFYLGAGRPG